MNPTALTVRISRRAIGAAVLVDEALTVADGRHLTSKSDRTVEAATRFLRYLLDVTKPALLVVDAPQARPGCTTARILTAVQELVATRGIELLPVTKPEILAAYGLRAVKNRRELRDLTRHYWPDPLTIRGKVEPFVVDAAAAALYADCRLNLERIAA